MQDVFKQYGDVKLAQVRYDKTDRSTGEGEVIFSTEADAARAYKLVKNNNNNNSRRSSLRRCKILLNISFKTENSMVP